MKREKMMMLVGIFVLAMVLITGACAAPKAETPTPPPAAPTPTPPPAAPTKPAPEAKPTEAKPIKLSFSHADPAGSLASVMVFQPWIKMVEDATDGRVKITEYAGGVLGGVKEAYEDVKGGVADISRIAIMLYPGQFPLNEALTMPGVGIRNATMGSLIYWHMYEKFPQMQSEFADVKALITYAYAPIAIGTTNKQIRTLEDIKGLKISGTGGWAKLLQAAGASPVPMAPADIYSSLEKGVLDGVCMGWKGQDNFRTYEVCKYYTWVPAMPPALFLIFMNLDKWDALPADIQEAMWSVCGEVGAEFYGKSEDRITSLAISNIVATPDREIVSLTKKEERQWQEAAKPLQDEYVANLEALGLPGKAFRDELLRMAEAYIQQ